MKYFAISHSDSCNKYYIYIVARLNIYIVKPCYIHIPTTSTSFSWAVIFINLSGSLLVFNMGGPIWISGAVVSCSELTGPPTSISSRVLSEPLDLAGIITELLQLVYNYNI